MKYSIYTSCFNIIKNNFNYWEFTIPKWLDFLENGEKGEVVICINSSEDDTLKIIKDKFSSNNAIKIIESSFDYTDYSFDGKIKNQALQNCKYEICLGLDLDEYLSPNKESWDSFASQLLQSNYRSLFIPVVDLCKGEDYYKSIGFKWYMHKQGLKRGVWPYAKLNNGKIDVNKSDTCELLDEDDNLVQTASLIDKPNVELLKKYDLPFVIHLGWLNWANRKEQNKTWQPVWSNRAGYEINNIIHQENAFDKIEVFKHNLKI